MRLEWSSACLVEEEEEEGYFISDDKGRPTRDDSGVISSSIDGLVCFYAFTREITVMNPATKWSYKLPLPNIQIDYDDSESKIPSPGFGKDYVTGTYKIVWLHSISNYDTTLSCEIFDFGVKQWRLVTPPLPEHRLNHDNLPTFANGWLYWFHLDATKLIAFDLHMEMFQVIPNPIIETSSSSVVDMDLGSIGDDRRLVWALETNGDGMQHVWRLTNHNTGGALLKMDKMFSIDLNKINPTYMPPDISRLFHPSAISKNGNKFKFQI
ncbi:PREDICTED: putative F-box protein At2g02030 [Camelina sativa]|uniref:F-box protein At2g02030 n=1 Tax=Camelina sativa TaxID=90675 RepID=A0ABM0ZC86_CAMSA|nr:PREDICTED: putative F-box protein At2g02030 [Camelina sativa]